MKVYQNSIKWLPDHEFSGTNVILGEYKLIIKLCQYIGDMPAM